MTDPAVRASRNADPGWLAFGKLMAVPCIASIFLTLTDAFGLEVLPLGRRFLYWLALLGMAQLGGVSIRRSLDRSQRLRARLILAGVLGTVVASVPLTVAVWLLTDEALSQPLRPMQLPGFYLPVLTITAAMVCINLLVQRRPLETHAAEPGRVPNEGAKPARILARLPPKLKGAALYAVQAEDHYIRFYTSGGSDLVLLRFSEALEELRGIEGAQVHRSWWVARDAVKSSRREEGNLFLVLHDGTNASVSRTFTRALRAEGWF